VTKIFLSSEISGLELFSWQLTVDKIYGRRLRVGGVLLEGEASMDLG
jgi:hypothetical protein